MSLDQNVLVLKRFGVKNFTPFSLLEDCELDVSSLNIDYDNKFGKTSIGDLYVGEFQGESVAVQLCNINDNLSALRVQTELTVLRALSNSHDHIASLYRASNTSSSSNVKNQIMITYYPPLLQMNLTMAISDFELSWSLKLQLCNDVISAVTYLHESNIVHRAINPNVVLIDADWHARLSGFYDCVSKELCDTIPSNKIVTIQDDFCASPELLMSHISGTSGDIFSTIATIVTLLLPEAEHDHNPFKSRSSDNQYAVSQKELRDVLPSQCRRELVDIAVECSSSITSRRYSALECSRVIHNVVINDDGSSTQVSEAQQEEQSLSQQSQSQQLQMMNDDATLESNKSYDSNSIQNSLNNSIRGMDINVQAQAHESNLAAEAVADAYSQHSDEVSELRQMLETTYQEIATLKVENQKLIREKETMESGIARTNVANDVMNGITDSSGDKPHSASDIVTALLDVVGKCESHQKSLAAIEASSDVDIDVSIVNSPTGGHVNSSSAFAFESILMKHRGIIPSNRHQIGQHQPSSHHNYNVNLHQSAIRRVNKSIARSSRTTSTATSRGSTSSSKTDPLIRRRLSPHKDPRTPPRKGPGSVPSRGEYRRNLGSTGSPHISMVDSKLLSNFYRADPTSMNRERFNEYHTFKDLQSHSNIGNMFLAGVDKSSVPKHGVIETDMSRTIQQMNSK